MRKTFLSFLLFINFLAFNSLKATDILQPSNANNVTVNVKSGDKFYDSGGPNSNYLDCNVPAGQDNEQNCTSILNICGQGAVNIRFKTFELFPSSGGGDNLRIYSGITELYNSLKDISPVGKIYTSKAANGCLIVKFIATSVHGTFGWDADIIVNPGTGGVDGPSGDVLNPGCNLVCNNSVNVSMPASAGCTRTLTPADFLQNPTLGCSYSVVLSYPFGTNTPGGGIVDKSHLGYTFIYHVVDDATGNSCWGYVKVEDKAGPLLMCLNRRASCAQLDGLTTELGSIEDNCLAGQQKLRNVTIIPLGDGCSDPRGIALVVREIIGSDAWGNTSTCRDTITITRNTFEDIICPDLVPLSCVKICNQYTIYWDQSVSPAVKFVESTTASSQHLYPSPYNLLAAQSVGCIPADTLVVPGIRDTVFTVTYPGGIPTLAFVVDTVPFYKSSAGICKIAVGYADEIFQLCPGTGSSFKIRRQWRFVNWCQNGRDTVCIQYIKVEDKDGPSLSNTPNTINVNTSPHDCNADVTLIPFDVSDCSPYDQYYTIIKTDPITGKVTLLSGLLSTTNPGKTSSINTRVRLSSNPYGGCDSVSIRATDNCLNESYGYYFVCVWDNTPPTPVCDEFTVTTLDPATCWARVYAKDLDNGSRDNCCNILHFAVATMASIDSARKVLTDYWTANCFTDYWNSKTYEKRDARGYFYDGYAEQWINCFVFKDYVDLTECGDQQVVLRIYEACGVPRYDPHLFPCSEHDWFTYNTYLLCRAYHNFNFFSPDGKKDCKAFLAPICRLGFEAWFDKYNVPGKIVNPLGGVGILSAFYYGATSYESFTVGDNCHFYYPSLLAGNSSNLLPPGNRCSKRLYNDCMVNIHVDDKTPPVCEGIRDLFYYCDGVFDVQQNGYPDYASEYANLYCYLPSPPFPNYTCGSPYKNIELTSENEVNEYAGTDSSDWFDPTGKYYGYYGCVEGVSGHPIDEHNPSISQCEPNTRSGENGVTYSNGWAPIYCHSWLTLDKYDKAGKKTTPKFWTPQLHNQGPNGPIVPGTESGQFKIWDNCLIGTPTTKDESYVDQCGNGWLSRTWTVGDKCNTGQITCTQKIYTKHRSDFEVMFPADFTTVCGTAENLSPDVTGRPMVMDDDCELVGVNFTDARFDIVGDVCFKIVRTWTLIDWCKYDPNQHTRYPEVIYDDRAVASAERYCVFTKLKDDGDGYMTYTQIIKVKDTIPPSLVCNDDTLCITTGYGGAGAEPDPLCSVPGYSQTFSATDNCTPANQIEYRYIIKNSGGISRPSGPKVTGFISITGDLTVGVNTLTVIASDRCGQEDTSFCTIVVKDCKKPTPYCYDGIATVVMPSSGEVTVWASDLNAGSYDNCTKKVDLKFAFDAAGLEPSRIYKCADAKPGQVTMYVFDKAGNFDFCTVSLSIQSNDPNCQPAAGTAGSISGKIATELTEPVENVILEAKGSTFKTDSKGTYSFTGLKINTDYTITPKRDDDPVNGVSTIDLVLIQKHILGVLPLNSAYKIIAADVDRSDDVSAIDLVELRKLILTVYDKLPNNTSWRFVPKAYNFSNATNPWGFPEKIDITGLTRDELNKDFVGIKIGDVNGTVVPHSLLGSELRGSVSALKFRIEDRELKTGEESVVDFTAENFNKIEGYQFSLALNGLELKAIHSGVLKVNENNFGMTKLDRGYITSSWNDNKGISVSDNEVLFSITVKATRTIRLSESLVINSKYTRAEAYSNSNIAGILDVELLVGHTARTGYALYQNTPNPFISSTVVNYDLPNAEKVTFKITDITGRVVRVYKTNGLKGYNQLKLNRKDLPDAGVLYYTIETRNFSATKKMVAME